MLAMDIYVLIGNAGVQSAYMHLIFIILCSAIECNVQYACLAVEQKPAKSSANVKPVQMSSIPWLNVTTTCMFMVSMEINTGKTTLFIKRMYAIP